MSTPHPHYVDLFYGPGTLDEDNPPPEPRRLTIAIIALPLFFVVTLVLAYIGSGHAPAPNNMELTIAGPDSVTAQLQSGLEEGSTSGRFDITRVADAQTAIERVQNREAVGAVVVEPAAGTAPNVTVVTAGAGGRQAASAVQSLGTGIATDLGATPVLDDVAPTSPDNAAGVGLFFFLLLCTLGAYLSISSVFRGLPTASRTLKLGVAGAVAVVTPVAALLLMSLAVGFMGMDAGQALAVLGIAFLYTLTVALLSLLFHELIGGAAVFLVVIFCLALNLPTSGGSVPPSMLPDFWQSVSHVWFGSGAMQSFQSVAYFDGRAVAEPFTRLLVWLGSTALGLALVYALKARSTHKGRPEKSELDSETAEPQV